MLFHAPRFVIAAVLLAASTVHGHMRLRSPQPYLNAQTQDANPPLDPGGSDFPCKLTSGDSFTFPSDLPDSNKAPVGGQVKLNFFGSATHGGGSCQIALTKDITPTKNSKWMVIHSIEGGCPANVPGNLPDDPNGTGSDEFFFTIPEGIEPGEYTLGWTWLNRIGNREFYMNCAPFQVTGGNSGSEGAQKRDTVEKRAEEKSISKRADFPDLFVANIAGINGGCTTQEGVDVRFPDPGQSVERLGDPANLMAEPACGGGSGSAPPGNEPSPTQDSPSLSITAEINNLGAANPTSSGNFSPGFGGQFFEQASSDSGNATPAPTASSSSASSAGNPAPTLTTTTTSSTKNPTATGTSANTNGALNGECSEEGLWNCIDGTIIQRCASGVWSTPQPLSQGTACKPGQSAELEVDHVKRSAGSFVRRRVPAANRIKH
ncbi:hypothetical protein VTN31DRAFT_5070 [Thermomyces dupontii]|uniref:uncharacterized protein n=1 Tax=Talaromyces thermophilus TaxID=28565 RepID=UPI003741FB81